jgi:hypothetical protein
MSHAKSISTKLVEFQLEFVTVINIINNLGT